jgi:hypothetical protein
MQAWEDGQLALLRPRWPDWDIWYVRLTGVRRTIWCAKPKGHPVATIQAGSPDELEWDIHQQP